MSDDESGDPPIQPEVAEKMKKLAEILDRAIPDGFGFALLVFELGTEAHLNYISNVERADVVLAMTEFVSRTGGGN